MKSFVNARNGISKIFTASILELICAIIASIALIVSGLQLSDGIVISISIISLLTFVPITISFFLNLIGLFKAGKDNICIHNAFIFAIFGIIIVTICDALKLISQIKYSEFVASSIIYMCASIFSSFIKIIVTTYVCQGCSDLLSIRGEDKLAQLGIKAGVVFTIAYALGAILQLMSSLFMFEEDQINVSSTLIIILAIAYLVLSVVAYIGYLKFLKKAKIKLVD